MEHTHDAHAHPTPKLYGLILGALFIFTGITVGVAFYDFGVLNNVIALGIAGVKTVLVVLFFMHVKYGSRLTKIFAATGFAFLAILIVFTVSDTETRKNLGRQKSVYGPQGWAPLPAEVREPGTAPAGHGTPHEQAAEH